MKSVFLGVAICTLVCLGPVQAHALQQYEYDLRGRLVTITYADGSVIAYEYDLHGNRTQRLVTLGQTNGAPTWSSGTSVSVVENSGGTVYTAQASDPDGASVTYSISGGVDAGEFAINASTGALSFTTPPDFENPTDNGANNVYNVTLSASDGQLSSSLGLTVTVSDVAEQTNSAPLAVNDSYQVQAGTQNNFTVLANDNDPEGDTLTIVSVSTPPIGFVSITGNQIEYLAPLLSSGIDVFTYTISDGNGGTDTATVTVSVEQSGGGLPF